MHRKIFTHIAFLALCALICAVADHHGFTGIVVASAMIAGMRSERMHNEASKGDKANA